MSNLQKDKYITYVKSKKIAQMNLFTKQKQIHRQTYGYQNGNVLVTQSRQTLCDPMDCSLPASSVHGILQVKILEWVAMPSSRGSS